MKQISFLLLILLLLLGLVGFTYFKLPPSHSTVSIQANTQPVSLVGKPTCTAEFLATLIAIPSVMPTGTAPEAPCGLPIPTVDPNAIPHGSPIAIVPFFIAPQTPVPKVAATNQQGFNYYLPFLEK